MSNCSAFEAGGRLADSDVQRESTRHVVQTPISKAVIIPVVDRTNTISSSLVTMSTFSRPGSMAARPHQAILRPLRAKSAARGRSFANDEAEVRPRRRWSEEGESPAWKAPSNGEQTAKDGAQQRPDEGADHPTHPSSAVPGPFSSPVWGRDAKLAGFRFPSGTTVFARLEGLIRPDCTLRLGSQEKPYFDYRRFKCSVKILGIGILHPQLVHHSGRPHSDLEVAHSSASESY